MGHNNWRVKLTEMDEFFGRKPRYPIATAQEHLKYELSKQNEIIKNSSSEISNGIHQSTTEVCSSLENGFSELYKINSSGFERVNNVLSDINVNLSVGLHSISNEIANLEATTRWGFTNVIEQLQLTNVKLNQIINLLNIPEPQKIRKYHIEQGVDFLCKANYNPIFFSKSKENFEKALEIEDTDYFTLTQLGIIHLYSKDQLNLDKAKSHFKNAALYSVADINFQKSRLGEYSSSFEYNFNASQLCSKANMHLARISFIEENYETALLYSQKAYQLNKNNLSNIYDLIKYHSKLDQSNNAVNFLEKGISKNRYISVKSLSDEDLIDKIYIQNYLKELSKKTLEIAKRDYLKIKTTIKPNSIHWETIKQIDLLVDNNNYLDSLSALELLGYDLKN